MAWTWRTGVAAASLLALSAALPADDLPANRWVKVEAGGGGVRRGSAVAWLAKDKKFLVVGGVSGNPKKKIAQPFETQTFDPAGRAWAEARPEGVDLSSFKADRQALLWKNDKGRFRLSPSVAVGAAAAFDPAAGRLYVCHIAQAGKLLVAAYDPPGRRWGIVSEAKPPAEADGEYPGEWGPVCVFLEGTAAVFDPVNGELLLIGGRTGDADDGFVGHWALSVEDGKWRELTARCAVLDPVRAKVLAAKADARDAMAAARNVFYAGLEGDARAKATKGRPAKLVARAATGAAAALEALASAKPSGWKAQAVAHARARTAEGEEKLRAAAAALAEGKLDAELIGRVFQAAWALDEAGDLLRALPGPRMHAGACYDPEHRCVVVFGGDHGDYLLSDTWVYDCGERSWRRVFSKRSPPPRRAGGKLAFLPTGKRTALAGGETYVPAFIYFRRVPKRLADVWTLDVAAGQWSVVLPPRQGGSPKEPPRPELVCQVAGGDGDVILGLSSAGRYPQQWDGTTWLLRVGEPRPAGEDEGVPVGARTYLSVVREYDPCWYDAAPAPDPKAAAAWLAGLKPNTWTAVPVTPRPAPQRTWGTAVFDPDRDQFYHWTGGHQADPASIVSTYHPAVHRWSIPYVGEYFGKGFGFNGRPDCMNHTYLNYAYDVVSKKLVCTASGGTGVYDPDRREFQRRIEQPFFQHPYYTKCVSTPKGVICWTRGWFGRLDVAGRKWEKLPVKGKLPPVVHGDENAVAYDTKRDCLWMLAADGYTKMNGQVWRYDVTGGEVRKMDPAGMKTIGVKVRPRECAYVPKLDLLVHNGFAGDRQAAYDPANNRWVTLNVARTHKGLGGVGIGLMYDPKRALLWAMDGGRKMYVLRIDPGTLEVSDRPGPEKPTGR